MSYAIVQGLKIDTKNNKVFLTAASNNVYPKNFEKHESLSLSEILREKGEVELKKEILVQYWNGNFQKSGNIYEKSMMLIDKKKYNWNDYRSNDTDLRNALYQAYLDYINRDKGHFVVKTKDANHFVVSVTTKRYRYAYNINQAKVFNSCEEAKWAMRAYSATSFEFINIDEDTNSSVH